MMQDDENKEKTTENTPENGAIESGGEAYRPEGLPDHMLGKTDRDTLNNVFSAYRLARAEISGSREKSGIPKTADEYVLNLPDDIRDKVVMAGDDGKDPILEAFKPIAHKHNLSQEAFSALATDLYKAVAEKTAADIKADESADADFKSFGGAEKAKPVIDGVTAWAKGLAAKGVLDDSDLAEIEILSSYGSGLRVLSKLRAASGEKNIPARIDGAEEKGLSQADLESMVRDPRYWRDKDPAFIAKVSDGFSALYGVKKTG